MLTKRFHTRTSILCSALAVAFLGTGEAKPFADLFKKDLGRVPASDELQRQENEAGEKLDQALAFEAEGKGSKAIDTHKAVVRSYPLTTAAATSQFEIGKLYQAEGKQARSFDAYQKFIDNYKGSSAFSQAVTSQYELAKAAQDNVADKKIFGMIPHKIQDSELLGWYATVIDNAPYSEYAPLSQFAIAEIYQNDEKPSLAIRSYEAFVEKYPRHEKSPEAQYRIGAIGKKAIDDGTQDVSTLYSARGAMEDVIIAYEDSSRADEARDALVQFNQIEAAKFFAIAKFYEKQKSYRSAAIYYQRVIDSPGSQHQADAQTRFDAVLAKAPDAADTPDSPAPIKVASPFATTPDAPSTTAPERPPAEVATAAASSPDTPAPIIAAPAVAAAAATPPPSPKPLLKTKKGYVGPPAPDLKITSAKPKMRANPASVPIVPIDPIPLPPAPDEEPSAGDDPPLPPEPDDDFSTPPPVPEP